MQTKLDGFK
jgi:hypothetical protein